MLSQFNFRIKFAILRGGGATPAPTVLCSTGSTTTSTVSASKSHVVAFAPPSSAAIVGLASATPSVVDNKNYKAPSSMVSGTGQVWPIRYMSPPSTTAAADTKKRGALSTSTSGADARKPKKPKTDLFTGRERIAAPTFAAPALINDAPPVRDDEACKTFVYPTNFAKREYQVFIFDCMCVLGFLSLILQFAVGNCEESFDEKHIGLFANWSRKGKFIFLLSLSSFFLFF